MNKDKDKEKELLTDSSQYISAVLRQNAMNGDAYVTDDKLFQLCQTEKPELTFDVFQRDLREQLALELLVREGRRIYPLNIWRCEEAAARRLAVLQMNNDFRDPYLRPESEAEGSLALSKEQLDAIDLALSHRLSLILGGAGCGKTTLIRSIVDRFPSYDYVLCAPTGKAARNLSEHIHCRARTVHSACGLRPDDDFQSAVQWHRTGLVIVDEASMLSLELLAHLLSRMPENCHLVLVGDPDQLQSVGAGNVIPDLLALGFPAAVLTQNYRHSGSANALRSNVVNFKTLHSFDALAWDSGFSFEQVEDKKLVKAVIELAAAMYELSDSFQVLTPYNKSTAFSVCNLNVPIRDIVNPLKKEMLVISDGKRVFRDGDRVMLTKNDREKDCNNGDIGILHICSVEQVGIWKWDGRKKEIVLTTVDQYSFSVSLPDGREPFWDGLEAKQALLLMELAYVITVHKSQGSQYGTILLPVSLQMQNMLGRNLFYTAISRATEQVILLGSEQAVDAAMQRTLPPRKSALVQKVQMKLLEGVS